MTKTATTPPIEPVPWITWLRRLVPSFFLLAVVFASWRELKSIDAHAVQAAMQSVSNLRLAAVQLLAMLAILGMTMYDWVASRIVGVHLPFASLVRYAWVANTFNNMIGMSGLAGSGIRFLFLSRDGVDGRRIAVYSAIVLLSIPAGLAVLIPPLLFSGKASSLELPLAPWLVQLALGGFAMFLPAYLLILRSETLRRRFVPGGDCPSWPRLVALMGISLLDWLLAMLVSWTSVFLAGAQVPFIDFGIAFILAAVIGMLSLVPGGLGVFDAVLLALLGSQSQTSADQVLAGLVIYRFVYYLMPWLLGVYLGAGMLTTVDRWQSSRWVRYWQDSAAVALVRLPLGVLTAIGVRALAYLTFGAGVVLLVSAAFPALADRLSVLDRYLPLATIEASHLLSVVIAVLLIAVSRGIADQVKNAYRIAIVLLVSGALFSLVKGIDYEEALILSLIAIVLRIQRKNFYRNAIAINSLRTVYWLLSLVIAVAGFMGLGAWVHGEIPLQLERLLSFAPSLEAPRFARSLLFATLVVIVLLAWSLFRSARPTLQRAGVTELAEAKAVLDVHGGSSFSHLVFLGDKYLYWPPQRRSFIQYATIRDRVVALGDPCGDPAGFDEAILGFREFADMHDLVPVFYEVADQHAYRYHDAGFALFKMGEMAYVELENFSLAGRRGESLRHSVNRAKREGLSFELWSPPFDQSTWRTLRSISDAWLQHIDAAEKAFSLGNFQEAYLSLTPIAVVKHSGKVIAFSNLMPDYGAREELSIDLMRYSPDAPGGTMDYMFVELLQWAKLQNYRYFNLGMAPLAGVGEARFARPQERMARLAFEYGNRFYNYKGLRSFKEKFHPQWRSHYLAYPVFTSLPALLLDTAALVAGGYRRIFVKLD